MSQVSAWQLNILKPSQTQTIYVSKGGNDVIGDGSILRPYATISAAMADPVITGANQVLISVGEGAYPEAVALKAGVLVVGAGQDETILSGHLTIDGASWAANPGEVGGLANLQTSTDINNVFDFLSPGATLANLTFYNVSFVSGAILTAADGTSSTATFSKCRSLGTGLLTLNGFASRLEEHTFRTGSILTVNSAPINLASIEVLNSASESAVNLVSLGNAALPARFVGFALASLLTLTGTGVTLAATVEGLSTAAGPAFAGGASQSQITYLTYAPGLGYLPGTPANWPVVPINVQQALDDLAGIVAALSIGVSWKSPVNTISTAPIASPPSNATTPLGTLINGYAIAPGTRVALNAQASPIENGIWVVPAGAAAPWTRAADLPAGVSGLGIAFFVEGLDVANNPSGAVGNQYVQNLQGPGTPPHPVVGTDPLQWVQFGATPTVSAPVKVDKFLSPTAVLTGTATTTLTISQTSVGYAAVLVNGAQQVVGDADKKKNCYWSLDGGVTALPSDNVPAGATLYWNASGVPAAVGAFPLQTTDIVSFDYNH
jgi:hypothetical protein